MQCKGTMFGSRFGPWRDRVDDTEHNIFADLPDGLEDVVGDALEFAQTIVDRTIEPLIDAISAMSQGKDAGAAWRSNWRAASSPDESERPT
ncbi:MAG: hypothetical protein M3P30_02475 [Chloroflexota bacterium]|nr:hypothetical protein [Chloroflexota bacterium]